MWDSNFQVKLPEWGHAVFHTYSLPLQPEAEDTTQTVMVQTSLKFVFYVKNSFAFVHFNGPHEMTFQSLPALHTGLTGSHRHLLLSGKSGITRWLQEVGLLQSFPQLKQFFHSGLIKHFRKLIPISMCRKINSKQSMYFSGLKINFCQTNCFILFTNRKRSPIFYCFSIEKYKLDFF